VKIWEHNNGLILPLVSKSSLTRIPISKVEFEQEKEFLEEEYNFLREL